MSNPYREIVNRLDKLVKSRFIEMFGNPLTQTSEYEFVPIRSFSRCVAGATPSTLVDDYWEDGTIPWLSSGEVNQGRIYSTEKKITQMGYDNCSTHIVPAHTVLIALAGQGKTRGTVAVTEIELCTNQSICSIITDETVEADYLYHALKIQYDRIRTLSNGDGGRGGLNLEIVGKITVPKPPISLQLQFAEFVNQVDKSRVIAQKAAEKYDQLVKSRFIELFEGKGYPVVPISTIAKVKSGSTIALEQENEGGPVMYVKVSDMNLAGNDKYLYSSTKYVQKKTAGKLIFPKGSIIFPKNGGAVLTNKKRIATQETTVDLNTMVVVPEGVRSEYLYQWFLRFDLSSIAKGSALPSINAKTMGEQLVLLPPDDLQKQFEEFVHQVDKSRFTNSGGDA